MLLGASLCGIPETSLFPGSLVSVDSQATAQMGQWQVLVYDGEWNEGTTQGRVVNSPSEGWTDACVQITYVRMYFRSIFKLYLERKKQKAFSVVEGFI